MNYHWNWAVFLSPVPSGETNYLGWLLVGAQWTLVLSLLAWLVALVLGLLFGVLSLITMPIQALLVANFYRQGRGQAIAA